MKFYSKQVKAIRQNVIHTLNTLVVTKGGDAGGFFAEKAITFKKGIEIEGIPLVQYIGKDKFFCSGGHEYDFNNASTDDLAKIVDDLLG